MQSLNVYNMIFMDNYQNSYNLYFRHINIIISVFIRLDFYICAIHQYILHFLVNLPLNYQQPEKSALFYMLVHFSIQMIKRQLLQFQLNCLSNMSYYIDEATNDTSNPFNRSRMASKKIILEQTERPYNNCQNCNTIGFGHNPLESDDLLTIKIPPKMTAKTETQTPKRQQKSNKAISNKILLLFDDSNTKPFKKNNKQSSQIIDSSNLKQRVKNQKRIQDQSEPVKVQISIPEASKQLTQKLNGPSLRQKYARLIPESHQQKISSDQQQLIKILGYLDESITYCISRQNKSIFYQEIRRKMIDSLRIVLDIRHLQQISYLDERFYHLRWQYSVNKGGQDIVIDLPKIKSKDQRKQSLRLCIIKFLNLKHEQFLKGRSLQQNYNNSRWHPEFQPGKYEIPRKPLPPHPDIKNAELRTFQMQKIQSIKNNTLKQLIKNQKQKADVKSLSSRSVMDMILKGKSSKDIQEDMLAAVKQRQNQMQQKKKDDQKLKQKQQSQINPQKLSEILTAIQFVYRSKNVANLFKTILLEKIHEYFNKKNDITCIQKYINYVISLKEIGLLKEKVINPRSPIICEANFKKSDQLKAHIASLKQTNQQAVV